MENKTPENAKKLFTAFRDGDKIVVVIPDRSEFSSGTAHHYLTEKVALELASSILAASRSNHREEGKQPDEFLRDAVGIGDCVAISPDATVPWDDAVKAISDALASAHQQGAEKERERTVAFGKWLLSLSPVSRCTVHPPAGSGLGHGLYEKSVEDLFNDFNRIPKPNQQ